MSLKDAGKRAAAGANAIHEEKINRLSATQITQIITELRASAVNKADVEKAIAEIQQATNKNQTILKIINTGSAVGEVIKKIISKF